MQCEECGTETILGCIKKSNGKTLIVCEDCKTWKGKGNPFVNRGIQKGFFEVK